MPYQCEMCHHEVDDKPVNDICAQCGTNRWLLVENPKIVRIELHCNNEYVSFYKDGFVGYEHCRLLGNNIREMHRSQQFELSHPSDLEWLIKGCEGVKNPTLLNGADITGVEMQLSEGDVVGIGSLNLIVKFVRVN